MVEGNPFSLQHPVSLIFTVLGKVASVFPSSSSFTPPQGRTVLHIVEQGRNQEASSCGREALILGVLCSEGPLGVIPSSNLGEKN